MRVFFFFSFLLFGFSAAAFQVCAPRQSNVEDLKAVGDHFELDWWAATPDQVWNAPCKSHTSPDEATMLNYLDSGDTKKVTATVNGITFKEEDPAMVQLFKDLNTYDYSMNGKPPLSFQSKCDKVLCAAKEIFGDKEGLQLLYMLKRYGFNGSALRTSNASNWKSNELDDVLGALSDYPDSLYPIQYNRKLTHFSRGMGYDADPDHIIANSVMEVFDAWNKMTQPERQQTFLHELGHVIAQQKNLDSSAEWYKLGGWTEKETLKDGQRQVSYEQTDKSTAVSEYGQTNPSEDFAETVVAYRFDGATLKKLHPEKFAYIKEHVFDGKEYLTEASCQTSMTRTEEKKKTNDQAYTKALAYVKAHPMTSITDDHIVKEAQNLCLDNLVKSLAKENTETESCTTRALKEIQLSKAADELGITLDASALTDKQLNQISVTDGGGHAFNQMVRTDFSKELISNIRADKRDVKNSIIIKTATDKATGCKDWAFLAVADYRQSPAVSSLLDKDKYYFFQNNRKDNIETTLQKACMDTLSAGPSQNRLDLSILKNMP